jgi:DNA-binding response OmpR family regulator
MGTLLPPTILVLDDDPEFSYLIRRYTLRCGCRSIAAPDAEATIILVRQEQPALIVLEIAAHATSGRSIVQRLKAETTTHGIPIAICSAVGDGVRIWEEEADYFLGKPVMYDDFVAILRKAGVALPQ